MKKRKSNDAFRIHLNTPFEEARSRVVAALKEEGFGVLTEVDVRATLKKKLDVDFRKYHILGVCNPPLAHQALTSRLDAGLLLPCNVILYEENGGTEVAILDPMSMSEMLPGQELEEIASEAYARLDRVARSLA